MKRGLDLHAPRAQTGCASRGARTAESPIYRITGSQETVTAGRVACGSSSRTVVRRLRVAAQDFAALPPALADQQPRQRLSPYVDGPNWRGISRQAVGTTS